MLWIRVQQHTAPSLHYLHNYTTLVISYLHNYTTRKTSPALFKQCCDFYYIEPSNLTNDRRMKRDKANSLTSPPSEAIIRTETKSQITASMI